eukprot:jgi/Astpho2/5067/Aster-x0661
MPPQVYDSAKEFKLCGAGLLIAVNGQAALEAINPELRSKLQAQGSVNVPSVFYDALGNKKESPAMGGRSGPVQGSSSPPKEAQLPFSTGWFELHQALFNALPKGVVELGRSFSGFEERADGVELSFLDGTSISAGVLIGADGYFSQVRQQLLQDGPPNFGGTVIWRARRPWSPGCVNRKQFCFFQSAAGLALAFPIVGDNIVWTMSAPVQSLEAAGVEFTPRGSAQEKVQGDAKKDRGNELWSSGTSKLERCLKVVGDHYSTELLHTMKSTDPSAVLEHGTYVRPPEALPEEGWGRGRASLLGDAAHPLRPTGQGANQALEDAAELGWAVQQHGPTADALRAYEMERLERVRTVVGTEQAMGLQAYVQNLKGQPQKQSSKQHYFSSPEGYTAFINDKQFHRLTPQPMRRVPAAHATASAARAVQGQSARRLMHV